MNDMPADPAIRAALAAAACAADPQRAVLAFLASLHARATAERDDFGAAMLSELAQHVRRAIEEGDDDE